MTTVTSGRTGSDSTGEGRGASSDGDTRYLLDGLLVLLGLSQDIGVCLDLDTLLGRIELAALRVLDCERLTVFLNEPISHELRSRLATGVHDIQMAEGHGIAGAAFKDAVVVNVPDAAADPRFNGEIDRRTGYTTRSLLAVPLRGLRGEIVGVLQLLNKRHGAFTGADEKLAMALGALTGVTLQRQILFDAYLEKQRLEHDLQLATSLQQSLLPMAHPRPDGYDIASWTQAAAATGGDFYDYIDLPDGRLGLVVADVAGHGLAASLLACETRALIRSAAASTGSLVEIAARTNDILYRDLQHERFVVLMIGALDAAAGRLEFIGAGCGPLVCRAREGCVFAEASMPPLAVLPAFPDGVTREISLGPGDLFGLVTDGFYEWENAAGHQYGMDRLRKHIGLNASLPAADLIRRLRRDVSEYAGGVKQVDDLTAMVVRRRRDEESEGRRS